MSEVKAEGSAVPGTTPTTPETTLASALAAAQGEFETVAKTKTAEVQMKQGGIYRYSYADLADIITAIKPVLARHGIAWTQDATIPDPGHVAVVTRLYGCGEMMEFGPFVLPSGGTAQAYGSALTYARRYALTAALGIASEKDDDAALSQAGSVPAVGRTKASQKAMKGVHALANAKGVPHEALRDWAGANLGIESLTELTSAGVAAMREWLDGLPGAASVEQGAARGGVPGDVDHAAPADPTTDERRALLVEGRELAGGNAQLVDWYRDEFRKEGSITVNKIPVEELRQLVATMREAKGLATEGDRYR